MKIDELTIREAKQLAEMFSLERTRVDEHPYEIGKCYLIRTVSYHWVGRCVAVYQQELVLGKASWVSDTGRFHECLRDGMEKLSSAEIEPVFEGEVILGRGAFIDVCEWHHALPEKEK